MTKYKIGLAISQFYPKWADELETGIRSVDSHRFTIYKAVVPGCSELPLMASWLFQYQKVDAVIVCGVVVRGQTTHYDSVCRLLEKGLIDVQMHWSKPVINGVITAESKKQVQERLSDTTHKGRESTTACIRMLESFSIVSQSQSNKDK